MKKVLLIAYYFPPAGGPSVQRILKFVRYLWNFSWEPIVLTTHNGAYPLIDDSLLEQVPATTKIFRTKTLDPFRYYAGFTAKQASEVLKLGSLGGPAITRKEGLARWIRANLFVPDARIGWVPFAVCRGLSLLAGKRIDAVLSSGPPHSTHLIGWALHAATGVPWVADFRDPWVDINYYHELPHSKVALKFDAVLEKTVLHSASVITTVSPSWRQLLLNKLDHGRNIPVAVIHNGFDAADFEATHPCRVSRNEFILTYIGSLYASRNPTTLWQALQWLHQRSRIPRLRLQLIGRIDAAVVDSLVHYGLDAITQQVGYLPHRRAVSCMGRSALLLLMIESFKHDRGMITGKLYEYLASGRPIMALGPLGGDAAAILAETAAGRLFDRKDLEGVIAYIESHYAAWAKGQPLGGAACQAAAAYSRRNQTQMLVNLLNGLQF